MNFSLQIKLIVLFIYIQCQYQTYGNVTIPIKNNDKSKNIKTKVDNNLKKNYPQNKLSEQNKRALDVLEQFADNVLGEELPEELSNNKDIINIFGEGESWPKLAKKVQKFCTELIKWVIIGAFWSYIAHAVKYGLGPGVNKIIVNIFNLRNTLPPKRKTRINDDFSWFFRVLFGRRQPDDFDHLVIVNRKLFLIFLILIVFIFQAEVICCAYDLIRYERKFNNSSMIRMRKIGQRPMMEK